MISIDDKKNCCGCTACADVCPRHSIMMLEDSEGFLYPKVDKRTCVDCNLCESVCPSLNLRDEVKSKCAIAAKSKSQSEILNSSSGGIFTCLARSVLKQEGVVYGAASNENWDVNYVAIEKEADLYRLQGSKYVQSRLDGIYN